MGVGQSFIINNLKYKSLRNLTVTGHVFHLPFVVNLHPSSFFIGPINNIMGKRLLRSHRKR